MKVISNILIIILIFLNVLSSADATEIKKSKNKALNPFKNNASLSVFDSLVAEINRLDGDGLRVRQNRQKSWESISSDLRKDLKKNLSDKYHVGRTFSRLNAAYPNLHGHLRLNPEYDINTLSRIDLPVHFAPEEVSTENEKIRYMISYIDPGFIQSVLLNALRLGDEIIAINNISISKWSDQNFEYCKFPLRNQCELEFFNNFKNEILDWSRNDPLVFTIKRAGRSFYYNVPVTRAKVTSSEKDDPPCGIEKKRYPNFHLVYAGFNACLFESDQVVDIAILRIQGFDYDYASPKSSIHSVDEEVESFEKKYWKKRANKIRNLIIDVTDNHGGEMNVKWSALFIPEAFQEQWVQFKKIDELEDESWLNFLFADDKDKTSIASQWKDSGIWSSIAKNNFLPPMPQFCASEDCMNTLWQSTQSQFTGKIFILTNHWCVSSCVGFIWTMKNYLKDRVKFIGTPDAADTTYARLGIEGRLPSHSSKLSSTTVVQKTFMAEDFMDPAHIFTQFVSVSQTTDDQGVVLSGIPQTMDIFVSPRWNESPEQWLNRLLEVALLEIQ